MDMAPFRTLPEMVLTWRSGKIHHSKNWKTISKNGNTIENGKTNLKHIPVLQWPRFQVRYLEVLRLPMGLHKDPGLGLFPAQFATAHEPPTRATGRPGRAPEVT